MGGVIKAPTRAGVTDRVILPSSEAVGGIIKTPTRAGVTDRITLASSEAFGGVSKTPTRNRKLVYPKTGRKKGPKVDKNQRRIPEMVQGKVPKDDDTKSNIKKHDLMNELKDQEV